VKTDVKTVAENEVLMTVEVPHDEVKAQIEHTVSRLRQETNLPGFRPGRAPREVIVQRFGNDYIVGQTLTDALAQWYTAAVIDAELDPVSSPEVDFDDFTGDGDFAFTARFQVRPTVTLGAYTGVEVPRPEVAVSDAQVDAQLAMLQERFATLGPVEDRAVATDDFVEIDFEGSVDGEPVEGAQAEGYMLQVGSGSLIPGFEEAVVGMSAGETKEFEVTFPDDYRAEELAGKPATFKVSLKEIKEKVVPPLDDELAKQASEFDTLDDLRAFMRGRIEEAMKAGAEREFRGRVLAKVVENATVAVPSAMVERQAHALYHELEESVGERGMEMAQYLEAIDKTAEEVETELQPRAEAIVKQGLVIAAVREAEQIEVGDDEVREYLTEEAKALERDATQHILEAAKAGRQDDIRAELMMAKTVDFIVENAVAVDEPAADATDDAGSDAGGAADGDDRDEAAEDSGDASPNDE
jgi:trigger factor